MTEQPVLYENAVAIPGQGLRHAFETPIGVGVFGHTDLKVTAGTGLAVDVSEGIAWIRGSSITDQGLYRCRNDAAKSSSSFEAGGIQAAHGTNPRLDMIVARVYDHDADNSGLRKWRLEVVTGTPTAGSTLDTRAGAAAQPASSLHLADVLVPAAAGSIAAGDIRDRRRFGTLTVPPLLVDVDQVGFAPLDPLVSQQVEYDHASHDLKQSAVAMILPRRINSATRIRWKYAQGSTATVGNWSIGIYGPSGNLIYTTGAQAFAGAADSFQTVVFTTPTLTMDAGVYYVEFGCDTSAGSAVVFHGVRNDVENAAGKKTPGPSATNLAFRSATGGTAAPSNLLAFSNVSGLTAVTLSPPVPLITLSVG
jgi:hypothetical protein